MTSENVFQRIRDHYAGVANELYQQAAQAGLLENSSDVGTEKEEIYRKILERHLPKSCETFLGGYVFDLNGKRSRQMDVIITNGNTPRFSLAGGNKQIAPMEGTIGVVETKNQIRQA